MGCYEQERNRQQHALYVHRFTSLVRKQLSHFEKDLQLSLKRFCRLDTVSTSISTRSNSMKYHRRQPMQDKRPL